MKWIRTLALASRAASASAAMALCSWTGSRASLLKEKWNRVSKVMAMAMAGRLRFYTLRHALLMKDDL